MALDIIAPFRRFPPGKMSHPARRMRTHWPAELHLYGSRFKCTVADISPAGAMLRLVALPETGSLVGLYIGDNPPIPAQVVWRHESHLGLRFLEEQPWVAQLGDSCPFAWSR